MEWGNIHISMILERLTEKHWLKKRCNTMKFNEQLWIFLTINAFLCSSSFPFVLHVSQCSTNLHKVCYFWEGCPPFSPTTHWPHITPTHGTCWIPSERWSVWNKMRSPVNMTGINLIPEPTSTRNSPWVMSAPPRQLFRSKSLPADLRSVSAIGFMIIIHLVLNDLSAL